MTLFLKKLSSAIVLLIAFSILLHSAPRTLAYGEVDFSNLPGSIDINDNPLVSITSADWTDLWVVIFGPDNNVVNRFTDNVGPETFFVSGYFVGCDNSVPGDCQTGAYHFVTYRPSLVGGENHYCTDEITYNMGQDYQNCLADSAYAGQDRVVSVSLPSAGSVPAPGGTVALLPNISIISPRDGDTIAQVGTIEYTTRNVSRMNVYYTDRIIDWENPPINPDDKILIAENVTDESAYVWDTGEIREGSTYRIVIDAFGDNGSMVESMSEIFSIDRTPPTYIVSADPPATHGKNVTISVDVSENLKEAPLISVTQSGGETVPLTMVGKGSHYEGVYTVDMARDGVALVAVSGVDNAGNTGTTTLSGGTFAVGVNPPPAPNITSPQKSVVVGTSTISVVGTVRPDTTALIVVNGVDTYATSSSESGAFAIGPIHLDKAKNRGQNILSVMARDQTGLLSEPIPLRVKYNIAPTVSIASPLPRATVSTTRSLVATAADENSDLLLFTYQLSPTLNFDEDASATSTTNEWITIGDAIPSPSYSWDSTEVDDGQYILRIIADDGTTKTYSTPIPITVRNTLPFIRFEEGRKTMTNTSEATVIGRAISPAALSPRPTISAVEYLVDGGTEWKPVQLESSGYEARFSLRLTGLTEGPHNILWRVRDSRELYGRASHPVIVDMKPPTEIGVHSPVNNSFVTDQNDENAIRDGLQISISGTAEPQSLVTLEIDGTRTAVKASMQGGFTFRDVDIARRGANEFTLTAADSAGNVGAPLSVTVIYDNPPQVSIITPKSSRGLSGIARISWRVSDEDGDQIRAVTVAYRRGAGAYIPLVVDSEKNGSTIDVTHFIESNNYQLRVSASDGIATGTDSINFSIDRTKPTLDSLVLDKKTIGMGDVLVGHGTARDGLSGIEYVEYSVSQEGTDAFVAALLTKGFLQKDASYTLRYPSTLADGTYTLRARAVDAAGNVSPELSETIIVDTSPPRVGSFDVLAQGVRVAPDANGVIALYGGMDALFEVALEGDTASASVTVGTSSVALKRDLVSGLWQGNVRVSDGGEKKILISATDRVNNGYILRPIGSLRAMTYGAALARYDDGREEPLASASVIVRVRDEQTGEYIPLTSVVTDERGAYTLALLQGVYEITLEKDGYKRVTESVSLERAGFVDVSFTTEESSGFWGFIRGMIKRITSI